MTKRIVLQGLELWGDVHYTVHRTLAQSHPQQPWSRSPAQPIALGMDGAGGAQTMSTAASHTRLSLPFIVL